MESGNQYIFFLFLYIASLSSGYPRDSIRYIPNLKYQDLGSCLDIGFRSLRLTGNHNPETGRPVRFDAEFLFSYYFQLCEFPKKCL